MPDMMDSSRIEVRLAAVTEEARYALGGAREARITQFPFRVGRDRRSPTSGDRLPVDVKQRRKGAAPAANSVYLQETGSRHLHISAAHFEIECVGSRFFLVDRGSACGTIVAGTRVGGRRQGGRTELRDGDEVIVGTGRSRYVFQFRVVMAESAVLDARCL